MHKQRLVTAAVVGAVATGVGSLAAVTPPLMRQASAQETTATAWLPARSGLADAPRPDGVGRLEAAPRPVRSGIGPQTRAPSPGLPVDPPPSVTPDPPATTPPAHVQPLIIAHRGASAYRPEETLDSYRLAIAQGADYIEADLVLTSDGALVARHENELSATTDVARRPEFAGRKRTKTINGVTATGWFTEDFTLAELRTLHALSRGHHGSGTVAAIPTLQEIIDLVRAQHRPVGLYLELKTPAYFTSIGLAPEPRLTDALERNRLTDARSRVYVESFDAASLRTVHTMVAVPEIQLVNGPDAAATMLQPTGLAKIRQYAVGVGIDRSLLGNDGPVAHAMVDRAHADRLEVHVFTFGADSAVAYVGCYRTGVDGIFTDNPDLALAARREAFAPAPDPRAS